MPNTGPILALVVDDDPAMRLLLTRTLEKVGVSVREAGSGEEAVQVWRETLPDIVLLDVVMPGMDGYAVCTGIRAHAAGQRVPILMLTGLDDMASIDRAYEAGATDFITKPINWTLLGHRVRYLLRASRAFEALAQSEANLADAQRIAHIGDWEWNLDTGAARCSDEIYRMFGMTPASAPATPELVLSFAHPQDVPAIVQAVEDVVRHGRRGSVEYRLIARDKRELIVHAEAEPVRTDNGHVSMLRGTLQDVTERRRAEQKIHTLAYYDALTGLPQRILFKDHLGRAIARSRRTNRLVATLCLDVDHFKRINDTLGHPTGDKALREIAARLTAALRPEDTVARASEDETATCVSRFGGDEFTVLVSDLETTRDADAVAQRLLDRLASPLLLDGHEIRVTASIGIAVAPIDSIDVDALLMHANAAMYHAKEEGRNTHRFYNRQMTAAAHERLTLETNLRRALARDELFLMYQPQVDTVTGAIVGAEALLRWRDPDLGLVPPNKFIPIAEQSDLIIELSEWVIDRACRQAQAWQDAGAALVPVAVNISSPHFRQHDFVHTVASALHRTGLAARALELEITEGILIRDVEATYECLQALKAIGVGIAIDDFGTGYSSLAYLKRFPIDKLKIDRSFVRDLASRAGDAAITKAILSLAHALSLGVIAEGVETPEQSAILQAQGCTHMQGFLFFKPISGEDMLALLGKRSATRRKLGAPAEV